MLGYARKATHMLSFDTNLAGELATTWGGEKEQRREGYQSEAPTKVFELWDHTQNGHCGGRASPDWLWVRRVQSKERKSSELGHGLLI